MNTCGTEDLILPAADQRGQVTGINTFRQCHAQEPGFGNIAGSFTNEMVGAIENPR